MAMEVCSEISSAGISPRISFSHDLNQTDLSPSSSDRLDLNLLESDFDFSIGNLLTQDLSSADELFSNGEILPVQIKKSIQLNREVPKPNGSAPMADPSRNSVSSEKKSLKELLSDEKQESRSFWKFKRSSSLNCETSKSRSLIRSLHFLSRSNSTGSAMNPKQKLDSRYSQMPILQKQPSISSRKSSASSSCSRNNFGWRNGNGNGNGGVGIISPLLNLPPPYIFKVTVSFSGFSSLFCNGKNKKKNKLRNKKEKMMPCS